MIHSNYHDICVEYDRVDNFQTKMERELKFFIRVLKEYFVIRHDMKCVSPIWMIKFTVQDGKKVMEYGCYGGRLRWTGRNEVERERMDG